MDKISTVSRTHNTDPLPKPTCPPTVSKISQVVFKVLQDTLFPGKYQDINQLNFQWLTNPRH